MAEDDNRRGCPISIAWDKEDGKDWINIRDAEGKILMKVNKKIWDGVEPDCGFNSVIRDSILIQICKLCG